MLYIFAIGSIATYGSMLAGWAGNNNWGILGSIRVSAQMISYEVAMGVSAIGVFMIFHTLRHTFASWYMINSGDLYRLQEYLGHSDIKLTRRYAHLSPEYRKAGVEFFGPPTARIQNEYKIDHSAKVAKNASV